MVRNYQNTRYFLMPYNTAMQSRAKFLSVAARCSSCQLPMTVVLKDQGFCYWKDETTTCYWIGLESLDSRTRVGWNAESKIQYRLPSLERPSLASAVDAFCHRRCFFQVHWSIIIGTSLRKVRKVGVVRCTCLGVDYSQCVWCVDSCAHSLCLSSPAASS